MGCKMLAALRLQIFLLSVFYKNHEDIKLGRVDGTLTVPIALKKPHGNMGLTGSLISNERNGEQDMQLG